MSYLIMECAASYAIALDEEGRFLKVPNLGYEVGQRVDDVVIFGTGPFGEAEVLPFEPQAARRTRGRRLAIVAAAACLVVAVITGAAIWRLPVGTVYMTINPEVSMEVNRLDRVVSLEGENADGAALIDGFGYYGRTVDEVSDSLADRAEERGYLKDGGTIELSVESDDEEWKTATEDRLIVELEVHLEHRVIVVAMGDSEAADEGPAQTAPQANVELEQEQELETELSEALEPAVPPAVGEGDRDDDAWGVDDDDGDDGDDKDDGDDDSDDDDDGGDGDDDSDDGDDGADDDDGGDDSYDGDDDEGDD